MTWLGRAWRAEPVALREAVDVLIGALIAWAVGFEVVHWTPSQIALVLALWRAAMGVASIILRALVTPNGSAAAAASEAAAHATVAERDRVASYLGNEAAKDRAARRPRRPLQPGAMVPPAGPGGE